MLIKTINKDLNVSLSTNHICTHTTPNTGCSFTISLLVFEEI